MFKAIRIALAVALTAAAIISTSPVLTLVLSACATVNMVTVMIDEMEAANAE